MLLLEKLVFDTMKEDPFTLLPLIKQNIKVKRPALRDVNRCVFCQHCSQQLEPRVV